MASVLFTGQLLPGVSRKTALTRLSTTFSQPESTFLRWFQAGPVVIRKNLTPSEATALQSKLTACGVECTIQQTPPVVAPRGHSWVWALMGVVLCTVLLGGGWWWQARPNPLLVVFIATGEAQAMASESLEYALRYGGHIRVDPSTFATQFGDEFLAYAVQNPQGEFLPHGTIANFLIGSYGWRFHSISQGGLIFTKR